MNRCKNYIFALLAALAITGYGQSIKCAQSSVVRSSLLGSLTSSITWCYKTYQRKKTNSEPEAPRVAVEAPRVAVHEEEPLGRFLMGEKNPGQVHGLPDSVACIMADYAEEEASYKIAKTLVGHNGPVTSVTFSPDGQTIASASWDSTIKLWNAGTGNLIRTLAGHSLVSSVTFSPDGQTIASASDDATIKLWNTETGNLIRTLAGHGSLVRSVTFSPDGNSIASASHDRTIKLWNAGTGNLIRTLAGHNGPVTSVTFSPDGRFIASASYAEAIKIWSKDRPVRAAFEAAFQS